MQLVPIPSYPIASPSLSSSYRVQSDRARLQPVQSRSYAVLLYSLCSVNSFKGSSHSVLLRSTYGLDVFAATSCKAIIKPTTFLPVLIYVSRFEPTRRTFVMPPRNNSAKFLTQQVLCRLRLLSRPNKTVYCCSASSINCTMPTFTKLRAPRLSMFQLNITNDEF